MSLDRSLIHEHRLQHGTLVQHGLQKSTGAHVLALKRATNGEELQLLLLVLLLLRILVAQHRIENAGQLAGEFDGSHYVNGKREGGFARTFICIVFFTSCIVTLCFRVCVGYSIKNTFLEST